MGETVCRYVSLAAIRFRPMSGVDNICRRFGIFVASWKMRGEKNSTIVRHTALDDSSKHGETITRLYAICPCQNHSWYMNLE